MRSVAKPQLVGRNEDNAFLCPDDPLNPEGKGYLGVARHPTSPFAQTPIYGMSSTVFVVQLDSVSIKLLRNSHGMVELNLIKME
jgi:hypothetical protein